MMTARLIFLCFGPALMLLAPAGAAAPTGPSGTTALGWGPHVGLTVDPDQIHLGVHLQVGPPQPGVRFRPAFDLGFGDNVTAIALNFDAVCLLRTRDPRLMPYLGAGIGANYYDFDRGVSARRRDDRDEGDGSDVEPGVNLLGGFDWRLRGGAHFFGEARIGLVDAPDLKLTIGWTFF